MPLSYENLDEKTRSSMCAEIEADTAKGAIYISSWLTEAGVARWPSLLLEAAQSHNDGWLADQLRGLALLRETAERRKPKGGYTTYRLPGTAADTMAEGEFNRFYVRGLCLRAISDGCARLQVYRAKHVMSPRPESEEKIGTLIDPKLILEDLRTSPGLEPALGVPPGPNSGLCLRIPTQP